MPVYTKMAVGKIIIIIYWDPAFVTTLACGRTQVMPLAVYSGVGIERRLVLTLILNPTCSMVGLNHTAFLLVLLVHVYVY